MITHHWAVAACEDDAVGGSVVGLSLEGACSLIRFPLLEPSLEPSLELLSQGGSKKVVPRLPLELCSVVVAHALKNHQNFFHSSVVCQIILVVDITFSGILSKRFNVLTFRTKTDHVLSFLHFLSIVPPRIFSTTMSLIGILEPSCCVVWCATSRDYGFGTLWWFTV